MPTFQRDITTAEQLLATSIEQPCELIRGELRLLPFNDADHGMTAANILVSLGMFVRPRKIGRAYPVLGCILERNPDTVRAADLCFISRERRQLFEHRDAYFPAAPDLAIEVVSIFDTPEYLANKVSDWLVAGSRMVLVAAPATRSIAAYYPNGTVECYLDNAEIDCSVAVPGWGLPLSEVFAE